MKALEMFATKYRLPEKECSVRKICMLSLCTLFQKLALLGCVLESILWRELDSKLYVWMSILQSLIL